MDQLFWLFVGCFNQGSLWEWNSVWIDMELLSFLIILGFFMIQNNLLIIWPIRTRNSDNVLGFIFHLKIIYNSLLFYLLYPELLYYSLQLFNFMTHFLFCIDLLNLLQRLFLLLVIIICNRRTSYPKFFILLLTHYQYFCFLFTFYLLFLL